MTSRISISLKSIVAPRALSGVRRRVLGNDFEAVVMDLLEGNYQCPRRVAVFDIAQGWVRDASVEVVHELRRRCDLQLRDIPEALPAFTDRHEGRFADVQLPLPIPIGI